MQSAPAVPVSVSLLDVPMITLVPAGQHDGSSPRSTVTICFAVEMFPEASRAVQVTTVRPTENFVGASLVTVTALHTSVATARPMFGAAQFLMVTSAGTDVNVGAVVSTTVTVASA